MKVEVDLIDHATFIDDRTLDLIAEAGSFVAPGLDYIVSTLDYARQGGFGWLGSYENFQDKTHYEEELDAAVENIAKALTRRLLKDEPGIGTRKVSERVTAFVTQYELRLVKGVIRSE